MMTFLAGTLFFSAALFALVVITEMLIGYAPMLKAALVGEPMPRTQTQGRARMYSYAVAENFRPRRLVPARVGA